VGEKDIAISNEFCPVDAHFHTGIEVFVGDGLGFVPQYMGELGSWNLFVNGLVCTTEHALDSPEKIDGGGTCTCKHRSNRTEMFANLGARQWFVPLLCIMSLYKTIKSKSHTKSRTHTNNRCTSHFESDNGICNRLFMT